MISRRLRSSRRTGPSTGSAVPRFDSPSVFASLLDDTRGGRFGLAPVGSEFTTKQMYLPDTAILVTRYLSESGIAEVLDFMPIDDPTVVSESRRIVRGVRGIRGEVRVRGEVAPRFDYGRQEHKLHLDGDTAVFECGPSRLHLWSLSPLEARWERRPVRRSRSGREMSKGFMLEWAGTGTPTSIGHGRVMRMFEQTAAFWRDWIEQSTYRGRWREAVERSAITLKLMTYAPTGALVAAPTAGLPEQVGGEELGLPLHMGA